MLELIVFELFWVFSLERAIKRSFMFKPIEKERGEELERKKRKREELVI